MADDCSPSDFGCVRDKEDPGLFLLDLPIIRGGDGYVKVAQALNLVKCRLVKVIPSLWCISG